MRKFFRRRALATADYITKENHAMKPFITTITSPPSTIQTKNHPVERRIYLLTDQPRCGR